MNDIYSRSIFNLFDLASRVGGVFSAMRTGGVLFTSAFSYRLMMSSLIGKLFHFRPKFQVEMRSRKSKSLKGKKKYVEVVEQECPVKRMKSEYSFSRKDSTYPEEDEIE
jgi:hypothetical protein